ncbi:hypothetical protein FACS1894137_03740 [Spirochaetia bacterium]|nr:hypothetical protein FACS1894137_03740 [Spirochaetia bacterium]
MEKQSTMLDPKFAYNDTIWSACIIDGIDVNGEWVQVHYEYQNGDNQIVSNRSRKVKMRYLEKGDDYSFRFRGCVWYLSHFTKIGN